MAQDVFSMAHTLTIVEPIWPKLQNLSKTLLRQLNTDLQGNQSEPTILYEDNQAAICLSKNPQCHGRSKHIDIRYHFIREQVNNQNIELKYCPTNNTIADMLTKGLGKETFEKLRTLAGLSKQSSFK